KTGLRPDRRPEPRPRRRLDGDRRQGRRPVQGFRRLQGRCQRLARFLMLKEISMSTITRLYDTHTEAMDAVSALEAAGFAEGDISIISNNSDNWHEGHRHHGR